MISVAVRLTPAFGGYALMGHTDEYKLNRTKIAGLAQNRSTSQFLGSIVLY